jgi:hypothetical protein
MSKSQQVINLFFLARRVQYKFMFPWCCIARKYIGCGVIN